LHQSINEEKEYIPTRTRTAACLAPENGKTRKKSGVDACRIFAPSPISLRRKCGERDLFALKAFSFF